MARADFLKALTLASLVLLVGTQPLHAGTITFDGDLAGALGGSISTPATIDAGMMPTFHFDSGDVAGVGRVSGDVVLANNTDALAGSITVTNFDFISHKPTGTGPVFFTIAVSQDYAYTGPPAVLGSESLNGLYTLTGTLQAGLVSMDSAINSFALPAFVVPRMSDGPPFPKMLPISPTPPPDMTFPSAMPMHLDLLLGVSLSDNAVGDGPRVDITSAEVHYAIPEPDTLAMSCLGVLGLLLGYTWQRWWPGQLVLRKRKLPPRIPECRLRS